MNEHDGALSPDRGSFPGFGESTPLLINTGSDTSSFASRFADGTIHAFSDALAAVNNCAHPVRLHGSSTTVDRATGEVVSSFSSADAPLGVLHRPCGNRRAHICPSCSRTYARDTFEMIRSGVEGGKTVPEHVTDNPLLFVTLTAPSFGHVHGTKLGQVCRPRPGGKRCAHGRPVSCFARHETGDPLIGAPLCGDCHDTNTAVIWQWHAPELWRRATIALRRTIAHHLGVTDTALKNVASLQYAKVAEYQSRGLIHFHALLRIDGPAGDGVGSLAPAALTGRVLADLVREAVPSVSVTADPVDANDGPRVLRFGKQLDIKIVRPGSRTDDPDGPLTGGQVAGYLAKYATKDATTIAGKDPSHGHLQALRATCFALHQRAVCAKPDSANPYAHLAKWSHMYGFRGHFSTKSRRYSITLGALRRARARFQALTAQANRDGLTLDTRDLEARLLSDDEEPTTLVIGQWSYAGTGWRDSTEEALAVAAATRAREYDQWKAETKTQ